MSIRSIHAQESLYRILDSARKALDDAAGAHADKLAWADYRGAEVLYAQALQQFLNNNIANAETLARQAEGKAREAKAFIEGRLNHTKQSISILLEQSSRRLELLRTTYRVEQGKLPPFRSSRCKYFFYQVQERLNKAVAAFFLNNFPQAEEHLAGVKSHLNALKDLLHRANGHGKPQ